MTKKKPNFIFILGDDWGWGDLGCFGHTKAMTPCLDQLAKEGTIFTQFYVAAPVCSPSRASFMTGQFPGRLKIHAALHGDPNKNAADGMANYLDPNVITVTKLLQQAGYTTGHFGKWHLGTTEDSPLPNEYGLDQYKIVGRNDVDWSNNPEFRPHSTEHIINKTIEFVEEHQDQPFFVQTWLLDPHATLDPTEEQLERYKRYFPTGVEHKHKGALAIYYSVLTYADQQIGRLLDRLDELGLSEDTVVIFTGDNGPEDITAKNASHSAAGSPGPFRGRKRSLYEGGIRMPFILRWPGKTPPGKVDNDTVLCSVDFLQTICSLAGVAVPEQCNFDGENMSSTFLGIPQERTKPIMWERRFNIMGHVINRSPMLAIRAGRWKLLMNPDKNRVELYDIPNQSMELNNLAKQYPVVVEKLSKSLLDWKNTLPEGPIDRDAGSDAYFWPK